MFFVVVCFRRCLFSPLSVFAVVCFLRCLFSPLFVFRRHPERSEGPLYSNFNPTGPNLIKNHPQSAPARWNPRSVCIIALAWLVLHIGCLFTPGLLDDVDSIYIEIARSMLLRHDYVTPYIDGIRFFDKPPLMYWLASGSMAVFGQTDWAARLPLALLTLALLLATYALGLRFFSAVSPAAHPDRGALYSALALATCIGPFLYTRFFIPDILICLWMTLAVHAFLIALDRISPREVVILSAAKDPDEPHPSTTARPFLPLNSPGAPSMAQSHRDMGGIVETRSALVPCLIFAAVTALNLLTKGIIGLVFPIAFVLLYLALTRQLRLLLKLHLIPSTLVFLLIAAPWHILAALRNPAIALPAGLGLPAHAGWAWFYLYNEHIARFLQRRIPHDYGQVPVLLFWLLAALWLFPWTAFLPAAILRHIRDLRNRARLSIPAADKKEVVILSEAQNLGRSPGAPSMAQLHRDMGGIATPRDREAALTLLLWAGLVLVFFTFSARQEYYSLPALPALALMAGGLLARADRSGSERTADSDQAARSALLAHRWLLVPLCSLLAAVALFFAITAPHTDPRTDIASLLSQGGDYNLSLSHLFDLTGRAMGLFRAPLTFVALGMIVIGPLSYILRRPRRNGPARTYAANLTMAAAAACLLLSMHEGLVRFYPTMGSKGLAQAIVAEQTARPRPDDLIMIDGELTSGSTLLFYTRQPAHFVNGRVNGTWYGSFWPDAPAVFDDDASLDRLWAGPRRIFLLTYTPQARISSLTPFGPVRTLASAGGKSILTNQP
jgi:4-amino-4-deoxy-L-arabinose transferase-like glycosyltransferase